MSRRPDGYHDLQTLFYPVGLHAGTARNPEAFCDILEITPGAGGLDDRNRFSLLTTGNNVDCPTEKNLVWRAAAQFFDWLGDDSFSVNIRLDKHLPDGAGMGGGSADAAFTLAMLADLAKEHVSVGAELVESELTKKQASAGTVPSEAELAEMALRLGADCPFFLLNRPAYAEGVGEKLQPVPLDLSGKWLLVVKPGVSVSTREAFAGVTPKPAAFDLRTLPSLPIVEWHEVVHNDFEDSIFPRYPQFAEIKSVLYATGALYASLTGSGSCLYGIYSDRDSAVHARGEIQTIPTITATYLLEL